MSQGLKFNYMTAWGFFETVREYDVNVSTLNGENNTTNGYWQFATYDDQSKWNLGLSLHIQRYPKNTFYEQF